MTQALSNEQIKTRVLDFHRRNRDAGLSYAQLDDAAHLATLDWGDIDRDTLLPHLRATAKLASCEPDPARALTLAQAGFTSAIGIARLHPQTFADRVGNLIGAAAALTVHRRARGVRNRLLHRYIAARAAKSSTTQRPVVPARRGQLALPAPAPSAQPIDYDAIFGEAPLSDVPHDASVIGPGAYFADLMATIERTIIEPSVALRPELTLAARRPDLANLALTADNATGQISTVDHLLGVMESSLAATGGGGATIAPAYPQCQPALAQVLPGWPTAVADGGLYIVAAAEAPTIVAPPPLLASLTIRGGRGMQAIVVDAAPILVGGPTVRSGATSVVLDGFNFGMAPAATAASIIQFEGGTLTLRNCVFAAKGAADGWAIRCAAGAAGSIRIENCTFVDTSATVTKGALDARAVGSLTLSVSATIVWPSQDAAPSTGHFAKIASTVAATMRWCDVRGGATAIALTNGKAATHATYADTNFDADPRFGATGDDPDRAFAILAPNSPSIGRGGDGRDVGATIDLYAALAWTIYPTNLPFDLDFVTGQVAMAALDLDVTDIDRACSPIVAGANGQNRFVPLADLGVSLADYLILTTPNADPVDLARYYGLASFAAAAVTLAPQAPMMFVASDVARWLGLTDDGLRDLIYQDLGPSEIASGVQSGGVAGLDGWRGFYVNGRGAGDCNTLALVEHYVPVGRQVLSFDGAAKMRMTATLPALASFTIAFWLYQGGQDAGPVLTAGPVGWTIANAVLTVTPSVAGAPPVAVDLSAFAGHPQWLHVATVYDAWTQEFRVYVNAQPVGAAQTIVEDKGPWMTGALALGSDAAGTQFYSGVIADLVVRNSAQTKAQLFAGFQRPAASGVQAGLPADLIFYWPIADGFAANGLTDWVSGTAFPLSGASAASWSLAGLPGQTVVDNVPALKGGMSFAATEMLTGQSSTGAGGVALGNLDRLNRFNRLAQRIGWAPADLDWAIYALSGHDASADAVTWATDLARIVALAGRMNLDVLQICGFFGILKPFGRGRAGDQTTLFDQVFNRPPLTGATFSPDMALTLSVIRDFDTPGPIAVRLAAMLGIDPTQLAAIVHGLSDAGVLVVTGESLSALYRYRMLAGWLGLDVDSLLDLLALTGLGRLDDRLTPEALGDFLDQVDWIRGGGFRPTDLRYLVTPRGLAPVDPYQQRVELEIAQSLDTIIADLAQGVAPWQVNAASFVSPTCDEQLSAKIYAKAVAGGYVTASGIATGALIALLPLAPFRVGSDACKTIADAIAAALKALAAGVANATVLIPAGTYDQDGDYAIPINIAKGTLTIQAEEDAATTIVDCKAKGRFLDIRTGGTASVVVVGLTIRNGTARQGGAINCQGTLKLIGCIVRGCHATNGGAVFVSGTAKAPAIFLAENSVFYANVASGNGGALYLDRVAATMIFSTSYGNAASGGASNGAYVLPGASLLIEQSIAWNGTGTAPQNDWSGGGTVTCEYSDVRVTGATPATCINADPGLVDAANGDFGLIDTSPCLGKALDGTNMGFGEHLVDDLIWLLLFPFAYAQIAALEKRLAQFFKNDALPLDVVLATLGPRQNGLEILLTDQAGASGIAYLREVYRYLLFANLFALDARTLSLMFSDPSLFSLTGTGDPFVPTLEDLRSLARLAKLRGQSADGVTGLTAYLVDPKGAGAPETLARLFDWSQDDVTALLASRGIADFMTAASADAPACVSVTGLRDAGDAWPALTVEAWIATDMTAASGAAPNILLGARGTDWTFRIGVAHGGYVQFAIGDGKAAIDTVTAPDPFKAGEWHHVAGIFDSSTMTLSLHVDGILVAHKATTVIPGQSATDSVNLGQASDAGAGCNGIRNALAEVRIWNMVRSGAAIRANMHRRIPTATADFARLRGYWPFDRGLPTDLSGHWTGKPAIGGDVAFRKLPAQTALVANSGVMPAYAKAAVAYDGAPPYADRLTVEAWVSTNTVGANTLFGVRHLDWSFALAVTAEGRLRFTIGSQGGGATSQDFVSVQSPHAIGAGDWHHVAAVFADGTPSAKLILYLDGVEVAIAASTTVRTVGLSSGDYIVLGQDDRQPAGGAYQGITNSLGEVRLWNTARTADQIRDTMAARIATDDPQYRDLRGYWTFADGSIADATATWHSGLLVPERGVTFARMPMPSPVAPADFGSIMDIADAVALCDRTGLSATLLLDLYRNGLVFGAGGVSGLIDALAAADADAGAAALATIADLKRDALKRFAIHRINGVTAPLGFPVVTDDDLSDYLLLDVDMGVGTTTSRIVQGTLSLQQYIQRCRIGLEPGTVAPIMTDREWDWIRTYRTWEANRKVFLYPETFLRPELRNTKTQLFADFEQALANIAPTREGLERLYRRYLDQFAVLASLQTVGSWFEPGVAIDTVMIARSGQQPAALTATTAFTTRPPYANQLTVEAWVSTSEVAPTSDANILFGVRRASAWSFAFHVRADGRLVFRIGGAPGTDTVALVSDEPLLADTWHHVAGVFDGVAGQVTLYVDGRCVDSAKTAIAAPAIAPGDIVVMGQNDTGGAAFDGIVTSLAEVRLWNVPRGQTDILATMRQRVASTDPAFASLGGYWPFVGGATADLTGYWTAPAMTAAAPLSFGPMTPPLDQGEDRRDRRHFIGRTRTQPPLFYHRTMETRAGQTALWTAWDKIELTIAATHATPVVAQGRLYLFWVELRHIDANKNTTKPTLEHYTATIKYSLRNADGTWLTPQSPFPMLALPAGFDPRGVTGWLAPIAMPVVNDGLAAMAVIYGTNGPGGGPYGFILNWDQSVDIPSAIEPDATYDYPALATASGIASRGLWVFGKQSVLTYLYSTLPNLEPRGTHLLGCQTNGTFDSWALGTPQAFSTWTPSGPPPAGTVGSVVEYQGALYAMVVAPDGKSVGLYYIDDPFVASSQWTLLQDNVFSNAHTIIPGNIVILNGTMHCSIQVWNGQYIDYVASSSMDDLSNLWTQMFVVQAAYNSFISPLQLFVDADSNLAAVCISMATHGQNSGLYTLKDGAWSGVVEQNFPSIDEAGATSAPVMWKGGWYQLIQNTTNISFGPLVLYTATAPAGPWTLVGAPIKTSDSTAISLVASGDMLVCQIQSDLDQSYQIFTTTDPVSGWTPFPGSYGNCANMILAAIRGTPQVQVLEHCAVLDWTPVLNQMSSYVFSVAGSEFLLEAVDAQTGGAIAGQMHMAVTADGALTLSGLAVPPDLSVADVRLTRLGSSAVHALTQALAVGGIPGLLAPATQRSPETSLAGNLPPGGRVTGPAQDVIGFAPSDANALYYREIFVFLPWLIAEQLQSGGRFQDARDYLEFIFKPSAGAGGDYWQSLWLRDTAVGTTLDALETLDPAALAAYHDDPFDAGAIADLRPTAYQRAIVTAYIKTLIAWGDDLFTQNTRETIDEADMLYRHAAAILGPRPQRAAYIPPPPETYRDLAGNAENEFLIALETIDAATGKTTPAPAPRGEDPNGGIVDTSFYFGIPDNPEFLSNWDILDDRLFKIRNGLDMSGKADALALFEPALSITDIQSRGRSGGTGVVGSGSAERTAMLEDRFATQIYNSKLLAGSVADFGRSLLQALEMQDSDGLFALQSSQQNELADRMRQIRIQDVNNLQYTLSSLQTSLQSASYRRDYYKGLLHAGLSTNESTGIDMGTVSMELRVASGTLNLVSTGVWWVPTIFGVAAGGASPAAALQAAAASVSDAATAVGEAGGIASTVAGYDRRAQDWVFQQNLAQYDITQIGAQIDALNRQIQSAQMQFALDDTTMGQARAVQDYYANKFTNAELYSWMADTLGALYQQYYQIALSEAQTAQATLAALTGLDQQFVNTAGWSSQWRGLLAGESLQVDLARIQQAFNHWEDAKPKLHLEKTISLRRVAPEAYLALILTGHCAFDLNEAAFDRDHPGHYLRALRTVTVALPGLTEERHEVGMALTRRSHDVVRHADPEIVRFLFGQTGTNPGKGLRRGLHRERAGLAHSVAGETPGQPHFNSGACDAFAGGGAVSSWELDVPPARNRVDMALVRDVVLTLRYQARDGGDEFRLAVEAALPAQRMTLLVDLAADFGEAWSTAADRPGEPIVHALRIDRAVLPRNLAGRRFVARAISALGVGADPGGTVEITLPGGDARALPLATALPLAPIAINHAATDRLWTEPWCLAVTEPVRNRLTNLYLLVEFDEV